MPESEAPINLLGDYLVNNKGEKIETSKALEGVDVVGLYFSAHWCPPCRSFTPVLSSKYLKLKEAGKKIEFVFLSSDQDENAFKEYHASMSFLALPYSERDRKEELSAKFGVRGIPNLKLLDAKTGEIICDNARGRISSDSFIEDFPYYPKPVYDIGECLDGVNTAVSLFIMMEGYENAEEKENITRYLTEIAVKQSEKNKSNESRNKTVTKFFTAKSDQGPGLEIRKLAGLSNEDDTTPLMLILDLKDTGVYLPLNENHIDVTPENVEKFISDFDEGKLEKKKLES